MMQPDSWVIGSADDCDVVIRKPTVSGHHCRLRRTPEGYVLEDLASANGTYVNGHRVDAPTAVTPQDRIRLGRRIVLPWPASAPGLQAIRIGALPDNDVVLDRPVISGHHAVLWIEQGRMTIEDLGSTNGTSVGPRRRRVGRARVRAGDTLYFGSYAIPVARLLELAESKG
jgi:pSer/pThr/pTyr-binding forkhead associated (FHA) protein